MRLPSLNALRAFEAAARHESFARAAQELCVTEGAVSRHVKLLEEELGVALFRRLTRKVELTEEGRSFLPIIGAAFAGIAAGVGKIARNKAELKLVSGPSFSIRWLVPRLDRFRSRDASIHIRLSTRIYGWEVLLDGEHDVGISCGIDGMPKGLAATRIVPARLTPICSPRFAMGGRLSAIERIADFDLLHSTEDGRDWLLWNTACAGGALDVRRGQTFPSLDMAMKAAVFGEGIVIGDLSLIEDEISAGKVIAPFPRHVATSSDQDYHFVCRTSALDDPQVAAFRTWLIEECASLL